MLSIKIYKLVDARKLLCINTTTTRFDCKNYKIYNNNEISRTI